MSLNFNILHFYIFARLFTLIWPIPLVPEKIFNN